MTSHVAATQRLCICADDFGMSAGINAAVLDLIARRNLSATGCLVLREAWPRGCPRCGASMPRASTWACTWT